MLDAEFVAAGHDDDDGILYSDASEEFFEGLKHLLTLTGSRRSGRSIEVELPIYTAKLEALRELALLNKKLMTKTWSCWLDGRTHCMACHACKGRQEFLGGW